MAKGIQLGTGRPLKIPPRLNLAEAIKRAEKLWGEGWSQGGRESIALALGVSVKSSSFRMELSALEHWGLLESIGDGYQLSPIARDILSPTDSSSESEARLRAFQSIGPYREIQRKYAGAPLPGQELLANVFIQEYDVPKDNSAAWAQHFMESAQAAGIISATGGRRMMMSTPELQNAESSESASVPAGFRQADRRQPRATLPPPGQVSPLAGYVPGDNMEPITVPFKGEDRKSVVWLPLDASDQEIEKIRRVLNAYKTEEEGA